MNKEDKKLQRHLVEEMMKVSKTNPDVMYYMESLMKYCLKIEKENNKQKEVLDKIKEYITSYESINTIQELDIPENNIGLDEETFIEMVKRYMKVHDKILELLEEIE